MIKQLFLGFEPKRARTHAKCNLVHSTPGFTFKKTNVFVNSPSWSDYV